MNKVKFPKIFYVYAERDNDEEIFYIPQERIEDCAIDSDKFTRIGVYELKVTQEVKFSKKFIVR